MNDLIADEMPKMLDKLVSDPEFLKIPSRVLQADFIMKTIHSVRQNAKGKMFNEDTEWQRKLTSMKTRKAEDYLGIGGEPGSETQEFLKNDLLGLDLPK